MAATFVVEDGSALENSNSYLSVADADQYHENHGASADWSGASTAEKEEALRMATQYLDLVYGTRWRGRRVDDDQALDWPRYDAFDNDDFWYDSDEIPTRLEEATAEMALRHITEDDGIMPDIDEPGTIKREMKQVGPLKKDITYVGGKSQIAKFRIVDLIVAPLIHPAMRIERA